MTAWYDNDIEVAEHECPTPLETPVGEFAVGDMFYSPAGRWETVTERTPFQEVSARIIVRTDRTGTGYAWTFWSSTKLPHLSGWRAATGAQVRVFELFSMIDAEVTTARTACHGHTVVSARRVRGVGWEITDLVDGATVEVVSVPSKARARSEVTRRARAHAKRLGVPLCRLDTAGVGS
jgi:hypothetical protein